MHSWIINDSQCLGRFLFHSRDRLKCKFFIKSEIQFTNEDLNCWYVLNFLSSYSFFNRVFFFHAANSWFADAINFAIFCVTIKLCHFHQRLLFYPVSRQLFALITFFVVYRHNTERKISLVFIYCRKLSRWRSKFIITRQSFFSMRLPRFIRWKVAKCGWYGAITFY